MYKTAHASIFHIKVRDDTNIGPSNFLPSEGKKPNHDYTQWKIFCQFTTPYLRVRFYVSSMWLPLMGWGKNPVNVDFDLGARLGEASFTFAAHIRPAGMSERWAFTADSL